MHAPSPCRAVLTPASDTDYSVSFELSNPTSQPITLSIHEPFLRFRVRATADGNDLVIDQPTLDIPVRSTKITVQPSGSTELVTPVRLRFHTGPVAQQRFVWSIAHEPRGVQLIFTLDLPAPFDQPFTGQVSPH
jgi:hypothetical protein